MELTRKERPSCLQKRQTPSESNPEGSSLPKWIADSKQEIARQTLTAIFALSTVVILVFINSSLQKVVECLMKQVPSGGIRSPIHAPANCAGRSFDFDFQNQLVVEICRVNGQPTIELFYNGLILRTFTHKQALDFSEWIRRCSMANAADFCKTTPARDLCPNHSPFPSTDYLCLSLLPETPIEKLVINGVSLTPVTKPFTDFIVETMHSMFATALKKTVVVQ